MDPSCVHGMLSPTGTFLTLSWYKSVFAFTMVIDVEVESVRVAKKSVEIEKCEQRVRWILMGLRPFAVVISAL
jgi:hypothetical protein